MRGALHGGKSRGLWVSGAGRVIERVLHAGDSLRAVGVRFCCLSKLQVARIAVGERLRGRERARSRLVVEGRGLAGLVKPTGDDLEGVVVGLAVPIRVSAVGIERHAAKAPRGDGTHGVGCVRRRDLLLDLTRRVVLVGLDRLSPLPGVARACGERPNGGLTTVRPFHHGAESLSRRAVFPISAVQDGHFPIRNLAYRARSQWDLGR